MRTCASSSTSGSMPILVRQRRHFPPSTNQLNTGTRSSGPRRKPHAPHARSGGNDRLSLGNPIDDHGEERPDQAGPSTAAITINATVIRPSGTQRSIQSDTTQEVSSPCRTRIRCSSPCSKQPCNAGASDLHLTAGRPATGSSRRRARRRSKESTSSTGPDTERMVMSLLDDRQKDELDEAHQVDFSFGIGDIGRFRANAFKQRGTLRARPPRRAQPRSLARRARCARRRASTC